MIPIERILTNDLFISPVNIQNILCARIIFDDVIVPCLYLDELRTAVQSKLCEVKYLQRRQHTYQMFTMKYLLV